MNAPPPRPTADLAAMRGDVSRSAYCLSKARRRAESLQQRGAISAVELKKIDVLLKSSAADDNVRRRDLVMMLLSVEVDAPDAIEAPDTIAPPAVQMQNQCPQPVSMSEKLETPVVMAGNSARWVPVEELDLLFYGLLSALKQIVRDAVDLPLQASWRGEWRHHTDDSDGSGAGEHFAYEESGGGPQQHHVSGARRNPVHRWHMPVSPSSSRKSERRSDREARLAWELSWRHAADLDDELWDQYERRVAKEWIFVTRIASGQRLDVDQQKVYHGGQWTSQRTREDETETTTTTLRHVQRLLLYVWDMCLAVPPTPSILSLVASNRRSAEAFGLQVGWREDSNCDSLKLLIREFGRFRSLVIHRRQNRQFPPPLVTELRGLMTPTPF
jgi:hypothetical protein